MPIVDRSNLLPGGMIILYSRHTYDLPEDFYNYCTLLFALGWDALRVPELGNTSCVGIKLSEMYAFFQKKTLFLFSICGYCC